MKNTFQKFLCISLRQEIWLWLLISSFILISCQLEHKSEEHKLIYFQPDTGLIYYPSDELGEFFKEVQLSEIFPDSKTFVDCKPLYQADSILNWYKQQNTRAEFILNRFVDSCFTCPEFEKTEEYKAEKLDIEDHLNQHWEYLTRNPSDKKIQSSLLQLNKEYVVPGGRFREIYYWDSYFTMEGLAASGRIDLIESMLDNFACLIKQYGHIPNGNRSYYLSRSQPPFFAEMVKLLMRLKGDDAGLEYLPTLLKEYKFWVQSDGTQEFKRTVKANGVVLNRYWDDKPKPRPESYLEDYHVASDLDSMDQVDLFRNIRAACESGWDFSSRWLVDEKSLSSIQTTNVLPVDLNCLMQNIEATLAHLYTLKDIPDSAHIFLTRAEMRKNKIRDFFWSDSLNFFVDFNLIEEKPMDIQTLAAVYPLYFEIATADQTEQVAEVLRMQFLKSGGLITTLNNTGQQWDAPNGWAPLHWLAIVGLEKYGYTALADTIATRWLQLNKKVYESSGKMMEKYNVENLNIPAGGGEYPLQDGFGWTNGVYLALINKGYSP